MTSSSAATRSLKNELRNPGQQRIDSRRPDQVDGLRTGRKRRAIAGVLVLNHGPIGTDLPISSFSVTSPKPNGCCVNRKPDMTPSIPELAHHGNMSSTAIWPTTTPSRTTGTC